MPPEVPPGQSRPAPLVIDSGPSPRLTDAPRRRKPARPAPTVPTPKNDPGAGDQPGFWDRESLTGLGISLGAHALLLLAMAVWYFAPRDDRVRTFDSRLAGSPFGDESGEAFKGGLGMDAALALPIGPDAAPEPAPFTSVPLADLKIELPQLKSKAAGSARGGGTAQLGTGQAGSGDGFGVARFGQGGETINGVNVKVGDPQFTLIWDSLADIDLHVLEPGGSEIFWEDRLGSQGGELDVDDIDGRGPENVNYSGGKGSGPPGEYKWYVHYYGIRSNSFRENRPPPLTRWKVRVKHDGIVTVYEGKLATIGQKSRIYTLRLDRPAPKDEEKPGPLEFQDERR